MKEGKKETECGLQKPLNCRQHPIRLEHLLERDWGNDGGLPDVLEMHLIVRRWRMGERCVSPLSIQVLEVAGGGKQ